jgi:hypothetical protein
MLQSYAKSTEKDVTGTRKASGIQRRYDHPTSLLQLKGITLILPRIIHFITR